MADIPSTRVDRAAAVAFLGAFLALVLVFVAIFVVPPLITVFVDDLGFSHSQAGDLMTAYLVGYVLLSLVAGQLADRYGAITVMASGLALAAASTFLFAATDNFGVFLVARLGIGAATGLVYAPGIAFVVRLLPRRQLSTGVGIFSSGLSVGILFVFLATPLLEEAASWRWAVVAYGVAMVIGTAVFIGATRPVSSRASRAVDFSSDPGVPTRQLVTDSSFLRICAALFMAMFVAYGVYTWIAPYFDETAGFSARQISLALAVSVAAGIPATLLGGWLSDRTGRPLLVSGSSLAMVAVLVVLAASDQIAFGVATLVALVATFGAAGALVPLFSLPAKVVTAGTAAKATGIATAAGMSGALVSTLLGGRLVEATDGYTVAFIVYVAAAAAALIVVFPLASLALRNARGAPAA